MKILLIGGNGFIGRPTAKQLIAAGHHVTVLHRGFSKAELPRGAERMVGDTNCLMEVRPALQELAPHIVVNFVLASASQAEEMMSALRGITGRVVVISSMDVYRACGVRHRTEMGPLQELPLTEESELRTQPAYSPAQMEMGRKIFSWMTDNYDKVPVEGIAMSDSELPGTVLRLPMVYGPADPLHRLFALVKRMLDKRRKILLAEDVAKWRAPKGFLDNVAQAIALAAISAKAGRRIYNIAEAESLTELEWAQLVAKEMHWDGEFVVLPNEQVPAHLFEDVNWAQHWVASSQRIRQELGYREEISRGEALRRTIEWERDHPPANIPETLFDYAAEDAVLA